MTELIIIFGALTLLSGVVLLIKPDLILGYLRRHLDKMTLHILAVVARLIIGVLLINQSHLSRFPLGIEILGWVSIIAALSLAVMGRQNFQRLMAWALTYLKSYGRIGGLFAAVIGGFLIYAFV